MESTGKVLELIGLKEVVNDEALVVLEDIVDTGTTLLKIDEILKAKVKVGKFQVCFLNQMLIKVIEKLTLLVLKYLIVSLSVMVSIMMA